MKASFESRQTTAYPKTLQKSFSGLALIKKPVKADGESSRNRRLRRACGGRDGRALDGVGCEEPHIPEARATASIVSCIRSFATSGSAIVSEPKMGAGIVRTASSECFYSRAISVPTTWKSRYWSTCTEDHQPNQLTRLCSSFQSMASSAKAIGRK